MTDEPPERASTDERPESASTDAAIDPAARGPLAVGVDVGGSGIKAAVVDTSTGELVSTPE